MRSLSCTGCLLLAATASAFAQAPRLPLSTIFRSKLAFYLAAPDSTPISTSVVVASSESPIIAQNAWIEIHGANLLTIVEDWSNADFSKGLPTSLGGVSAMVNNKPAAIYYISSTQVNVLTPLDNATGPVPVQVTTPNGTTAIVSPTMASSSPAFLIIDAAGHVGARQADFSLLGPANISQPGFTFTPAKPGTIVLLYGFGWGQTIPPITSQSTTVPGSLPQPWPVVTIGGVPAQVIGAGISGAGLYQFNVMVPAVPNGDQPLSATYNGLTTEKGVFITIQN